MTWEKTSNKLVNELIFKKITDSNKFYKENKEYLMPGNPLQLGWIREGLPEEVTFELILNVKKVLETEHSRQKGKQMKELKKTTI